MTPVLAPPLPDLSTEPPGLTELRAGYPAWVIGPCLLLPETAPAGRPVRGGWLTARRGRYTLHVEGVARMRAEIEDYEARRRDCWK